MTRLLETGEGAMLLTVQKPYWAKTTIPWSLSLNTIV